MKAVWKHRMWQNFDNPAKLVLFQFYKGASLDEKSSSPKLRKWFYHHLKSIFLPKYTWNLLIHSLPPKTFYCALKCHSQPLHQFPYLFALSKISLREDISLWPAQVDRLNFLPSMNPGSQRWVSILSISNKCHFQDPTSIRNFSPWGFILLMCITIYHTSEPSTSLASTSHHSQIFLYPPSDGFIMLFLCSHGWSAYNTDLSISHFQWPPPPH